MDSRKHFDSNYFDAHVALCFCQRAVPRDQWSIERFRKGQVSGVVGCQSMLHLPDACEQDQMRIACQRKINEIGESFAGPLSGDDCGTHVAPQYLRDFEIDEMRGMERLVWGEDQSAYGWSRGRPEENLENRGSVDNDQRPCLSARTAAAGVGCGRTG
jgi:hypothetical protein